MSELNWLEEFTDKELDEYMQECNYHWNQYADLRDTYFGEEPHDWYAFKANLWKKAYEQAKLVWDKRRETTAY